MIRATRNNAVTCLFESTATTLKMVSASGLDGVELQGLSVALEPPPASAQGTSTGGSAEVSLLHAAVKRIARSNMALARTLQPGCSGLSDAYARYDDTDSGTGTSTSTAVAMTSADHTAYLLACACGLFRIARFFIDR